MDTQKFTAEQLITKTLEAYKNELKLMNTGCDRSRLERHYKSVVLEKLLLSFGLTHSDISIRVEDSRKMKLVVIDENTLAYIEPGKSFAYVLHASVLKGSPYTGYSGISYSDKKVRLASPQDFNDFRVSFGGYQDNNEFLYETMSSEMIEVVKSAITNHFPGSAWWADKQINSLVNQAVAMGYAIRGTETQVQWSVDGVRELKKLGC